MGGPTNNEVKPYALSRGLKILDFDLFGVLILCCMASFLVSFIESKKRLICMKALSSSMF